MPIIKIPLSDRFKNQATARLRDLARFDACDLKGEFESERRSTVLELRSIQVEAERLGENWAEIYSQIVYEMEIYESDREPELFENE